jgi:hypothetical protein
MTHHWCVVRERSHHKWRRVPWGLNVFVLVEEKGLADLEQIFFGAGVVRRDQTKECDKYDDTRTVTICMGETVFGA